MREGVLLSGVLHIFVLLLILFGIPWFWEPETLRMTATPVTVVSSDQLTAPKVTQEKKTEEKKEEPPKAEIPIAPPAPTLPDPVVEPEPPTVPEVTENQVVPEEAPNPEPQESANPQEEDTPEPVIAEQPKEETPPEPIPVPTEQVAEVQDVPVPPQKPEPPKKKEEKRKDETKKTNEEDFVGEVINKLADEQTAAVPPQEEVPANEPQTEGIPQRLPAGEEDALRNYIRQCWFSPGGVAAAGELVVTLEIKMNPDATLRDVEISRADRARMGDPTYRSFAENAQRAVQKCGAGGKVFPLNLERDYGVWSYIIARFRESDFY